MKSVIILGSTGMLGYGVVSSISKYRNIELGITVRSSKKIKDIKNLFPYKKANHFHVLDINKISKRMLEKIVEPYDYIINCIGIIKPEIDNLSSNSLKNAIYINSIFPKILAEIVSSKKKKFFKLQRIAFILEKKVITKKYLIMMI